MMTMFNQYSFADDEPEASIEFLEFLADGVSVEQEFLDPMNYHDIEDNAVPNNKQDSGDRQDEAKDDE